MSKKMWVAGLVAVGMLSANFAYAEGEGGDWRFTLSAKSWREAWSGWNRVGNFGGTIGPGTLINTSDTGSSLITGATVRYKDMFVNMNNSASTSYSFPDRWDGASTTLGDTASRAENDLNLGYYLSPQLALTLGTKTVELTYSPTAVWTHSFNTVGLSGSARIGESSFFMYENGAVSISGDTTISFTSASYTKGTPDYKSLEGGLGWAATKNLIFTAGYKFQDVQLPLTFVTPVLGSVLTINTHDTTEGFIFGAAVTF
jgi:hypothetical protein